MKQVQTGFLTREQADSSAGGVGRLGRWRDGAKMEGKVRKSSWCGDGRGEWVGGGRRQMVWG